MPRLASLPLNSLLNEFSSSAVSERALNKLKWLTSLSQGAIRPHFAARTFFVSPLPPLLFMHTALHAEGPRFSRVEICCGISDRSTPAYDAAAWIDASVTLCLPHMRNMATTYSWAKALVQTFDLCHFPIKTTITRLRVCSFISNPSPRQCTIKKVCKVF